MAQNPPLIPGLRTPLPVRDELFILQRKGVRFEAELMGGIRRKWDLHGTLYISTLRMCFVVEPGENKNWMASMFGQQQVLDLDSYDLPLSLVTREKFNQPIFGCNNIDGECSPLPGTDGVTKFKLSFMEGGVGTFLPIFFDLLNRNRHGPAAQPTGFDHAFQSSVSSGSFMRSAFVDPNDPTQIFLSTNQPPAPPQGNSMTRGSYFSSGYTRLSSTDDDQGVGAPSAPPASHVIPTATTAYAAIPTATAPEKR